MGWLDRMDPTRAHSLLVLTRFALAFWVYIILDDRVDYIDADLPRWVGRAATAGVALGVYYLLRKLFDRFDPREIANRERKMQAG